MKASLLRIVGGILTLIVLLPVVAHAQEYGSPAPATQSESLFSPEELDQLLSPVALYPDPLLAQILMASTYPLEVVEAARWVRQPNNAALKGDRLAAALEGLDWDPSVKSLVPFPQILQMMDSRLDWMEQLGDAFLAQSVDVTNSVQRLRRAAQAAGTLGSTPQQVVMSEGETIMIEPVNPDVIYVPVYDPRGIYGTWPYAAYPPLYIYPPGYVVVEGLISFGIGVFIIRSLWGWGYWDWPHHRIELNVTRFNLINVHRPRITSSTWQHDPFHRRAVPYRDPRSRERYEGRRIIPSEPLRTFRGYSEGPRVAPPSPAVRPAPGRAQPPRTAPPPVPREQRVIPGGPVAPAPGVAQPPRTAPPIGARDEQRAFPTAPVRPAPSPAPPQRAVPPPSPREQRVVPGQPAAGRTPPPAFEGIGRGHDVRTQENRGRASSQTMPQRSPRAPAASPSGGGAGRAAGGAGKEGSGGGKAGGGPPRR